MREGLIILLSSAPPSCVDFPWISPFPAVSNSVQQQASGIKNPYHLLHRDMDF